MGNKFIQFTLFISALLLLFSCSNTAKKTISGKPNINVRPFNPMINGKWVGAGISYGPFRDGEGPDKGSIVSKEHLLEDMKILSKKWNLLRVYGTGKNAENILEVIKENNIPMLVMQGAWINGKAPKEVNDQQILEVIELANEYPDIICAVNIGNEILVDWSWHRVSNQQIIIDYIRQTRAAIKQPVTVNDDFNYWNKSVSKEIADEVDFIGLHGYAFWNNQGYSNAITWTKEMYQSIQELHPNHQVAFCETGWPTSRIWDSNSFEGKLVGIANEDNQKDFYAWFRQWVIKEKINSFYFEAFDENWKGGWDGENAAEKAEKHWGLYEEDRSPKPALLNP